MLTAHMKREAAASALKTASGRSSKKKRRVADYPARYSIGDRVEVRWKAELFDAAVIHVRSNGKVDVVYDIDGSKGTCLTAKQHGLKLRVTLTKGVLSGGGGGVGAARRLQFQAMRVTELKQKLKARGLLVSGKKPELVERLLAAVTAAELRRYAKESKLRLWQQDKDLGRFDWEHPCLFTSQGYVPHTHAVNEAIFVQSGTITVVDLGRDNDPNNVKAKRGAEIVASEGDVVTIAAGVNHQERCSGPGSEALGVLFEYG